MDALFDSAFARLERPTPQEPPLTMWQKLGNTWPAQMAKSALNAAALPGQVAGGVMEVRPSQPGMWSDVDEARSQANQQTMRERTTDLAGLVTGGSYAAPAVKNASGMGIRAYHGSPHDFDRFDLKKVGTGEGTQMEGHGLYFGQSPDVADFYHKSTVKEVIARRAREAQALHPDQQRRMVEDIEGIVKREGVKALDEYEPPAGFEAAWAAAVDAAKNFKKMKGSRYEVNIKANLDDFYDLDKPLKDQPPKVYDAINRVGRDPRWAMDRIPDDARGVQLRPILKNPDAVAELARLGVPGSKYWDQFSRKDGEGTKNLVVFDDKLIDILRKYGIAGGGVLAAAGSDNADAKPAQDFGAKLESELQAIMAP